MVPDGEHGERDGNQHHGVEGTGQECDLDRHGAHLGKGGSHGSGGKEGYEHEVPFGVVCVVESSQGGSPCNQTKTL